MRGRASYLLDTATLTGAQRIALGTRTAGVMGSDDLRDRVAAAGRDVGEQAWAMPLPAELRPAWTRRSPTWPMSPATASAECSWPGTIYRSSSPTACSGRTSTWPGPAYNVKEAWGYTPAGATGAPVRTLLAVLRDIAENG